MMTESSMRLKKGLISGRRIRNYHDNTTRAELLNQDEGSDGFTYQREHTQEKHHDETQPSGKAVMAAKVYNIESSPDEYSDQRGEE